MSSKNVDSSGEYHRRICRAIDFVNAHLADNPSVADVAAAAPFSPFHFQRLFRAIVGESVAQFTRRLRLESAARKLTFAKADITGLSIDLGFSSSQNFAKAFRKHFGVSPSEYREQKRTPPDPSTDRSKPSSSIPDVSVRTLDSMRVVYQRHLGAYDSPDVQVAFDNLQRWAEARELHDDTRYVGIPWDEATITPDEKCRFDACLIVADDAWYGSGINLQTIPSGRYASYRTVITDNNFDLPWTELMGCWLPASGYQPDDRPRFELYHSDGSSDPDGRWDIEVCLPVKPL